MKYTFLIVIALLSVSAQAKSMSADTTKVENNNISYRFTSDANNLYLNISTTDRGNMMTMLRSGVSVFFDVKGKKKKNVYVKYPINSEKREERGRNRESSDQKRPELSELINGLPKKAEYNYFENIQQFHTELNTQNIRLGFEYLKKERVLVYNLKIPKEQILEDRKIELSKLSIGVVIGEKDNSRQSQSGNQRKQGSRGGGQRGVGIGGSGGGGRSGSGGGRGQRGGTNSQQKERPSKTTIDFWFDAISKK